MSWEHEISLQRESAEADTLDVPGILHQGVISLLRDDPWLAHDLLGLERPVDGTPLDRSNELDVDGGRPLQLHPIYPDLVLVYIDPNLRPGNPRRGIVIFAETQLEPDPDKRWRLSGYQGLLALLHQLDVHVVVVSFSRAYSRMVRSWAQCSPRIEALILDADTVRVLTPEQARARPTAAVLAAALHGARGDIGTARIAIEAIAHLTEQQRHRYTITILAALPPEQRDILSEELPMNERNALWEIERRSGTFQRGHDEGRQEGRQEGRRTTLIDLILAVLEVRDVPVDAATLARIRAEEDLPTLERWSLAARKVTQVSQLV